MKSNKNPEKKIEINNKNKSKNKNNEENSTNKIIESKKEKYSNLDNNNILNKKIKRTENKKEKKISSNMKQTKNYSFPKKFTFLKDFICDDFSNNANFIIFKSIDDIYILIYNLMNNSIITYDIKENKKMNEIKNAHNENIEIFKYYLDKRKKRDLILSLAHNELKVWNMNILQCIFKFEYENDNEEEENLKISANFLYNKNKVNIIINFSTFDEPIKVYNLKGKKIKEIEKYKKPDYIDTFYDNKLSKSFIIIINEHNIISYDYIEDKKYQDYYKGNSYYYKLIINRDDDEKVKLIGIKKKSIKIWDFHTGQKLKKIILDLKISFCILWNNQYLLAGSESDDYWEACNKGNNVIIGINLKNGDINKNILIYKKFYLNYIKARELS